MRIVEEGKDPDVKTSRCKHCKTVVEANIKKELMHKEKDNSYEDDIDGHGRHIVRYTIIDAVGYVRCPVCSNDIVFTSRNVRRSRQQL